MNATQTTTTHHSESTPEVARTLLAKRSGDQLVTDLTAAVLKLDNCSRRETADALCAAGWLWAELADRMGAEFADSVEDEAWKAAGR